MVENELPGLEENHSAIVQEIKQKEWMKYFLCNEKIIDLISNYIEQNE